MPPAERAKRRSWSPTMVIAIVAVLVIAAGAGVAVALIAGGHSRSPRSAHGGAGSRSVSHGDAAKGAKSGTATQLAGSSVTATTGAAPSASAHSTVAQTHGPAGAIRGHLEDLENGRYQAAFDLMTAGYRAQNPQWASVREEADPTIRIAAVGAPHYGSGDASVYVDFYAQDTNATPGSDTYCRQFTGTVELVKHGSTWQYDPYGDHLTSKLRQNADCRG
jgi:hypothetical protein